MRLSREHGRRGIDAARGRRQHQCGERDRRLQWRRPGVVDRVGCDVAVIEQLDRIDRCDAGDHRLVIIDTGPTHRKADFVVYDPVQHVSEYAARRRAGYVRDRHYVT
jgi:hypothetical protein